MMNSEVAERWTRWAATERKYYLREKYSKTQKSVKMLLKHTEKKS